MADTTTLQRLSNLAVASLGAVALTDAAAIAVAFPFAGYLRSLAPQVVVADRDLVASELAYGLAGLLQFLALIAAVVCFVRWFHHVYGNIPALTDRPTNHDRKWTAWGFVVPFLNVVRPQQIMRETWDVMIERWLKHGGSPALLPADRVNLWWGLYLAMFLADYLAGRVTWRAISAEETVLATTLSQVADAISLLGAVAAMRLVRHVTQLQHLLLGQAAAVGRGAS